MPLFCLTFLSDGHYLFCFFIYYFWIMKRCLHFSILLFLGFLLDLFSIIPGYSQDNNVSATPTYFGVNAYYGFILLHKDAIGGLIKGHPMGLEMYYERQKTGFHYWEQAYRYPRIGLALGYYDLRSQQLGKIIYSIYSFDKDLVRGRRAGLSLKIGSGIGYATNPFNLDNNYQNIVISSRISYSMRGALTYSTQISKQVKAHVAATLTHFSNGAIKLPNSGINLPMLSAGVSYTPFKGKVSYQRDSIAPTFSRKPHLQVIGSFMVKEVGLPGGKKYPGFSLISYVSKQVSYKSALSVGVDAFYYTSLRQEIKEDPAVSPEHRPDFKRLGVTLGHELLLSPRFCLLVQLGAYAYKKYATTVDAPIYQRYGLKYQFHRGLSTGVFLKTHYGAADCIEWTIGIRW